MDDNPQDKKSLRDRLKETIKEIKELGGWEAFKSGEWLLNLIRRSFRAYYFNANAEYFRRKYPRSTEEQIIKRLTSVAAKNAGLLGAVTGASVSANEIVAIVAGAPTGGLNLPAQITIAGSALAAEAILLVRIQLQLIANIAKLLNVPLDPDDPEDVLLVLGLAVGGMGAEGIGKVGAKVAGHATKQFIRKKISGASLQALKRFASRLGLKILQRSIIKYAVPAASILVGGGWNYISTRAVSKVAIRHFHSTREERETSAAAVAASSSSGNGAFLHLRVAQECFDAVRTGVQGGLYRKYTPYWKRRLDSKTFSEVHLRAGVSPAMCFMRVECRGISIDDQNGNKRFAIALGRVLEIRGGS